MSKIKCISLWQPYASLVAIGCKRVETRSWATKYRGPIAIHAAKRVNQSEMIHLNCTLPFHAALASIKPSPHAYMWEYLPLGAIVAVANLTDCRPTGSFTGEELDTKHYQSEEFAPRGEFQWNWWRERDFGDYTLGRFGWVLEDIRSLPEPVPYKGEQGLFHIDAELVSL